MSHSATSTTAAAMAATISWSAETPSTSPKRMPRRSPVYVRMLLKSTMPTANIPENTTPIAVSSLRPDRRATAPIASADATAAIEPPITMLIFKRNAITTPGKAACAIASPRNASPRSTTKTPTLAHTSATSTAASSARCTNAYWSGSRRSGMVLVRDVLRTAWPVSAVRAPQDRVVTQDRSVAIRDDAAVHREHAREMRHHTREIVCGDEDRAAMAREIDEECHELLLRRRIDARGGLIEQQQLGIRCKSAREKNALTLTTRQGLDRPPREVVRLDAAERGASGVAVRGGGPSSWRRVRDASHEDDELASAHGEIDIVDHRASVIAGADAVQLDDRGLTHGKRRYASRRPDLVRYFSAATILSTTTRISPM